VTELHDISHPYEEISAEKAKKPRLGIRNVAFNFVAEPTGLEPATSDVTGRRSNQLNYDSTNIFFTFYWPAFGVLQNLVGGTGLEPVALGV
jgi:hypothetical protein